MKKILILLTISFVSTFNLLAEKTNVSDFGADENIANYISSIDALILKTNENVYESIDEEVAAEDLPEVNTNNKIKLIYTIYKENGNFVHHLSLSQSPYLPSLHAQRLAALFSIRACLPKPDMIYKSDKNVYHVPWGTKELTNTNCEVELPEDKSKYFFKNTNSAVFIKIEPSRVNE